jgi:5-methyltetrahydrofolate--homocysteine methyltransferase
MAKTLSECVIKGDQVGAVALVKEALAAGVDPRTILNDGLIAGMGVVGNRFKKNEVYIPEVLISARAMKMAMEVLAPKLAEAGVEPIGKAVIGTVQGDLHDIGKNLVVMMLKGAGFEVIDVGVDVKADAFVEAVRNSGAKVVGLSALLTTTMPAMEGVVKALRGAKLDVKTMIGGAPVTKAYAERIGADGYAADAASAVDMAKSLLKSA